MVPHIAVIGSFVVGMTVRLPRMPLPGESLRADLFDLGPGGKGTNLAVAAVRLGAHVDLIVKLGVDDFANMADQLFRQEGIETTHVLRTTSDTTGVGLVYLDARSGENTIGVYSGANMTMTPGEVQAALQELDDIALVTAQLEVPDGAVEAAFKNARARNAISLLNPAPARQLPATLLSCVDVITPNINEVFQLLGEPVPDDADLRQIEAAGRRLQRLGPHSVIITIGSRGALVLEHDGQAQVAVPPPVKTVDTVGAGDAFSAGLAVMLAENRSLLEAARVGSICGAIATEKIGVVDALPFRSAVEEHLR